MPFKLRLKKSRQYNVVSKSLFVIGIELLDSTSVECTLTAESIGRECLDNICQRLSFQQPEFFGLRYVSRNGAPRWIELDRPLKRQLDKSARNYVLYLRVMYYVNGISLLTDEVTRYHYFLQLKSDVIEGRISCDPEQAILLASYSMQAEFGNYDPEKHTPEYLKDFVLFPKHFLEQGHLESLTEAVICQHAALAGLPQGTAEEYYILAAQQLDGYGQETFLAKDESGIEVLIGISLIGITVTHETTRSSKFYRWKQITNVINHKRYFGIECQIPDETVQFQFSDVKSAKYVWRMCVHQHTFFIQYGQLGEQGNTAEIVKTLFSNNALKESHADSSHDELDSDEKPDMRNSQDSNADAGCTVGSNINAWERQRAQSTSCLDLADNTQEIDRLRALLPCYRPAPDYETAIQQKYTNNHHNHHHHPQSNPGSSMLYGSHPDIHRTKLLHEHQHINSAYKHYPDVAQVDGGIYRSDEAPLHQNQFNGPVGHTYSTPDLDSVTNHLIQGIQMINYHKPPPPYPINRPSSNSTPDLASQTFAHHSHCHISSQVSGSSPDLVSSRTNYGRQYLNRMNYANQHLLPNPETHRTYTNLAGVLDSQQRIDDLRSRMADGNSLYASQNSEQVLKQNLVTPYQSNSKYSAVGNVSEPIYENVPLPWAATNKTENTEKSNKVAKVHFDEHKSTSITNVTGAGQTINIKVHESTYNGNLSSTTNITNSNFTDSSSRYYSSSSNKNATSSYSSATTSSHDSNKLTTPPDHSVNTSTDSSQCSGSNSGTLGKDKGGGGHKGRRKWTDILGVGNKSKHPNRNEDDLMDYAANRNLQYNTLTKHPLPVTISKEAMCQLLEKKLEDSQLIFEFENIPRFKGHADFSTALLPENISRNRHKDIVPYEENRVRLSPTKENRHGYINASNITASVGNQQKFYIAAQSPLPCTLLHFWQMIWESDVYLVVSLMDLQSSNTIQYFPSSSSDKPLEAGDFMVRCQFSQETGHCVTTKLSVMQNSTRRVRGVWHLQYNEWVTDGCPKNVAHFLGFLEELSSVRQHATMDIPAGHNRNPPTLVHCSTGIGRTGVTILSDLLLFTLDHNQELDIARVVLLMRHQRMLMIETVTQYRFVYSLLAYYLKTSRLI